MFHSVRKIGTALSVLSVALAGTLLASSAQADTRVFSADDLEIGTHTSTIDSGPVRILATEDRSVSVDANSKTGSDGSEFNQRLKLGGAGTSDYRSVHFSTTSEATLTVFALSSSASEDRALELYTGEGAPLGTLPAFGDPGATIPAATVQIPEAGNYYLASPSSGVNIYAISIAEGAPAERTPWNEVESPEITGVAVDPEDAARLLVSFTGDIGPTGADVATATLRDSEGNVAAEASSAQPGDSGTVAITPPASGSYTVELALTRADEATAKLAEPALAEFTLPLGAPEVIDVLTTDVTDGRATLTVEWREVLEAESYNLLYRPEDSNELVTAITGTLAHTGEISGLEPGRAYVIEVHAIRGEESRASEPFTVTASTEVERWQSTHVGVGSGGSISVSDDGTVSFDARDNSGKIADSEDGFLYYYTQIDPETENFTLSATFTVVDSGAKDNQSGFGVIAVDDFTPGDPAARYFNSAGAMLAKYSRTSGGETTSRYGIPGAKFVTGYSGPPTESSPMRDMSASEPFDWDYKADYTEGANANPPKFTDGESYTLTLRRSNTGYHAITAIEGEPVEIIHYDADLLEQQNPDGLTVGLFAARKIAVTASDISFTTIDPADDDAAAEPPVTYIDPELTVDSTRTTPQSHLDVPIVANVAGAVTVLDDDGLPVDGERTAAGQERVSFHLPVSHGSNHYTAELVPSVEQDLGEHEELSSYDPIRVSFTIERRSFGKAHQAILVAPEGTADGDGTARAPLDLHTAVAFAQPGQQVVLQEGTYTPTEAIVIERGNSGTSADPIVLMSAPGTRAVLDLRHSDDGGIHLRGDHWHLYNLEITGSVGYAKPLLVSGHHNRIERIETHHNGDTGLQISGTANEPREMWPSHNTVLSSVSHNNADPQANDADGFAAKLTVGEGNSFRFCIAHHNIDDGWDLYAKSTTGAIAPVVIEDSVAYRNGVLSDDISFELVGEGNGFKLGGESMPGAHVLRNSIAFDNLAKGVTSNSGPDVRVHDVTTYLNGHLLPDVGRMNLQLRTNAPQTDYAVSGFISYLGQQADDIRLSNQEDTIRTDDTNYFDSQGVSEDWFVSLDTEITPTIAEDGSIDMHGLLELTSAAPQDTGARLGPNPDPTDIEMFPLVPGSPGAGEPTPGDSSDEGGSEINGEPAPLPATGAPAALRVAGLLAAVLTVVGAAAVTRSARE